MSRGVRTIHINFLQSNLVSCYFWISEIISEIGLRFFLTPFQSLLQDLYTFFSIRFIRSTCRCPFFFAKLLPGRMVKYRHANRQRTERQLSANQRFGYFINSSVCFLALSPSFRSLLMHEKSVPGKRSRKASKGGKKETVMRT